MSSRRPRRSRIYDLNYNIGENYYKSAIDRLDEKYSSRPSVLLRHSEPPAVSPPRTRLNLASADDTVDDLDYARERASRVIQHETLLDQHSGRKALALESTFDGQVQKTLDRIQASKKLLNSIDIDNHYDSSDVAKSSSVIKKRTVKMVSDISSSSAAAESSNELTKWSKNSDYNDSESYAKLRARQSAAHLQDIEQDMLDRSERQFKREQRAANVKKLLSDTSDYDVNGLSNGVSSLKITQKSQKRITSY